MPAWDKQAGGLSPGEIDGLLDYVQPPESRRAAMAGPDALPVPPRGDAAAGSRLFLAYCSGCHGMTGRGGIAPEIGNPAFQQAASDAFIVTTVRRGRRNTAMPAFQPRVPGARGLSDAQLGNLLAYIRALTGPPAAVADTSQANPEQPGEARR